MSTSITANVNGWEGWLKQHKTVLPGELIPRYRDLQPWFSGQPYLSALSRVANLEKHAEGVAATVTLTDLAMSGTWQVEGLWERDGLADGLRLTAGTLDITSEREVIGTIELQTRIHDLGTATIASNFTFAPVIRFDDQEIPMLDAIEVIGREVGKAISSVSGTVTTAAPTGQVVS